MKIAVLLSALLLAACDQTIIVPVTPSRTVRPITYQELRDYPLDCEKADSQLAELKAIQEHYDFESDVELLTHDERAWNGIIKSNIWWFAYRCNKS